MRNYEAIFYEKADGSQPAKEFILGLDVPMRAKVLKTIELIEDIGPQARMPYSEQLEDGIFEVRAKVGSNISRVLYFFFVGKKIVLTNGFIKKTQKTPKEEILRAKRYRKDYLNREGKMG